MKNLIIFGGCLTSRALEQAIHVVLPNLTVQRCDDTMELRSSITQAALSTEFRSTTHVLCVTRPKLRLTSAQAFSMHCQLRQTFRLGRREFAWEGGIVFLGGEKRDCQALAGIAPFNAIPGHAVVPSPYRIIEILVALKSLEELRQYVWSDVLAMLGLSEFWAAFDEAERLLKGGRVEESVAKLTANLKSVLKSGILEKLLEHIEVRRELIRLANSAEIAANDADRAGQILETARLVMARYRLN